MCIYRPISLNQSSIMKAKSWTQMTKFLKILKLYNWFIFTDFFEQYTVIVSANPTCVFRWIEILHNYSMHENLIQALDASLDYITGQNLNQKREIIWYVLERLLSFCFVKRRAHTILINVLLLKGCQSKVTISISNLIFCNNEV